MRSSSPGGNEALVDTHALLEDCSHGSRLGRERLGRGSAVQACSTPEVGMKRSLWLAIAILIVGVGCPSELGINGRIDAAMRHDQDQEECPPHTHWAFSSESCTETGCPKSCVAD